MIPIALICSPGFHMGRVKELKEESGAKVNKCSEINEYINNFAVKVKIIL